MKKIAIALALLLSIGSTAWVSKSSAAPKVPRWDSLSVDYPSGFEMKDGHYYYISKSITFSNGDTKDGLTIAPNATVHIYIPKGVTLSARGGNASGRTGAGAGIYLPESSTLFINGQGKVEATGGNASDGSNGGGGYDAYQGDGILGGSGGRGGDGGGGAGAGIGTRGGTGGVGGDGGQRTGNYGDNKSQPGVQGNRGSAGSTADNMGRLFVDEVSGIELKATGGSKGSRSGSGGGRGRNAAQHPGSNVYSASGGGGGGGGGFGGEACNIGIGGPGGGAGGGGAAGNVEWSWYSGTLNPYYFAGANGGDGGDNGNHTTAPNGANSRLWNPYDAEIKANNLRSSSSGYTDGQWYKDNKPKDGGEGGSCGLSGVEQEVKHTFQVKYNVMEKFGNDVVKSVTIGYRSNVKDGTIKVTIPTTYELGFIDQYKYVLSWNDRQEGNGPTTVACYDELTIGSGTKNVYAEWKNYKDIFPEGYGTKSLPFIIQEDGLLDLAEYVNGGGNTHGVYFKQKNDVIVKEVLKNNNKSSWTPIGQYRIFEGDYDGGGYLIRNGEITNEGGNAIGIFGKVSGAIHNVGVESMTITPADKNAPCGAIVGMLYFNVITKTAGWMRDCYATENTITANLMGGMVGMMAEHTSMSHCLEHNSHLNNGNFGSIGGYIHEDAKLEKCYTRGSNYSANGYNKAKDSQLLVSDEHMKTGAITWLLNDETAFGVTWHQNINMGKLDNYPVLSVASNRVFFADNTYSNSPRGTLFSLSGKGLQDDPFLITNKEGLELLAKFCNEGNNSSAIYFLQTADIDLQNGSLTTIGNARDRAFAGHYDGAGHTIRHGNIQANGLVGIFGAVSGTVSQLCVDSTTIKSSSGNSRVGGIAGRVQGNGEIANCFVKNSTVTANRNDNGVAGALVGDMVNGAIVRNNLTLRNTVSGASAGYVCGEMVDAGTKMVRCYTDGNALCSSIVRGTFEKSQPSLTASSLETGKTTHDLNNGKNTPEPIWFQNINSGSVLDKTPVLDSNHAMVFLDEESQVYTNDVVQLGKLGEGTADDPYKIATPKDLENLLLTIGAMKRSNFHVLQTADIDLKDSLMLPLGTATAAFTGHYDGGGHVIRNMVIEADNTIIKDYMGESLGLFNNISGVVERLGIEHCTLRAAGSVKRVGAFAGKLIGKGVLRDCYVKGSTIDFNNRAGVIVGALVGEQADTTVIETSYGYHNTVRGMRDGLNHYGHIVGYISSTSRDSLVFTDGPSVCADAQPGARRIVRSEAEVDSVRFMSGELCWQLIGPRGDTPVWHQSILKDQTPVPHNSHGKIYRHISKDEHIMYTNSDALPYTAALWLDPNHDQLRTKQLELFKTDANYYVPAFKLGPYALERLYYEFAGWNTKPNGRGTAYPYNGSISLDDAQTLYAIWDMKVPATAENTVQLASNEEVYKFKVYDNGGIRRDYGYDCKGKLTLSAPSNDQFLLLTGNIATETAGSDGKPRDFMVVYDGDNKSTVKLANDQAKSDSVYYSSSDGIKEDIGRMMSTGSKMTIYFESDSDNNFDGLDLTVTVLPAYIRVLGQGSQDDPFKVKSLDDLETVDDFIRLTGDSKIYIRQTADIDMQGKEFFPLATSVESFEGHYDGGGFAIRNMALKPGDTKSDIGLFHHVSGVVERLSIERSTIQGDSGNVVTGAFAGRLSGSGQLRYCYTRDNSLTAVAGSDTPSALVGLQADASLIESCYSYHNVVSDNNGNRKQPNNVGIIGENATQHLVFLADTISEYRKRCGVLCYELNSPLRDSIIWRQTIGPDSLPTLSAQSKTVYLYNQQGAMGYTNETTPTVVDLTLEDIATERKEGLGVIKGSMLNFAEVDPVHHFFFFKGWNTQPDGSGTAYPKDTLLIYHEPLSLYAQYDMVIDMAKNDSERILQDMPRHIPYAKVYDDGGSDGPYTGGSRYVTLTAPEGRVLQLQGTVTSRAVDASDGTPRDYLAIYDGPWSATLKDNQKVANDSAKSGAGWQYLYYSTTAGKSCDIGTLSSSGRQLTLLFHTAIQDTTAYAGLDLTVKAVPVDSAVAAMGRGTEAEPYRVMTMGDLQKLSAYSHVKNSTNFCVRQMADINAEGLVVEPLFNDSLIFTGHYDGGGHVIRNVKMDDYKGLFVGVFGAVSGVVERLGVENSTFKAIANDARAGALAGIMTDHGLLRNCYAVNTSVAYNGYRGVTGALVGEQAGTSRIESCLGYQNQVSGFTEQNERKRYGDIAGDIANTAKQNFVFTDGSSLCSDGQGQQGNISNAYKELTAARMASGEVCYLLNGSRSDSVTWRQTINTDTIPLFDSSHGVVYYHQLGEASAYTNSATAEFVKLHLVDLVDSIGNKDVDVLKNSQKQLAALAMQHQHYVFTGWNTQADGSGTAYVATDSIRITEDLTLYSQWEMKVVMPKDDKETAAVSFLPFMKSGKVYDDGGSDGAYTAGSRYVTLTAPEGCLLQLKGSVATRTSDGTGTSPLDYLAVFDAPYSATLTSQQQLSNSRAKHGEGWRNLYYSDAAGEAYNIGSVTTSGRQMTLLFHTDRQDTTAYAGLDLTVSIVSTDSTMAGLGKGTKEDPYKIASSADLKNLAEFISQTQNTNVYVEQVADIDMTGIAMKPIGTHDHPFSGTYDGCGHTVSNASLQTTALELAAGLFGMVTGTVTRLGVEHFTVRGVNNDARIGAIAGRLSGNGGITNCYAKQCTMKSVVPSVAGAIVADMYDQASVKNCFSYHNTLTATRTGHICSDMKETTLLERCYTDGDALVSSAAKGTVRECKANLRDVTFRNGEVCYLLNNAAGNDSAAWHQTLGTDNTPVLNSSHGIVYQMTNPETQQTAYANSETESPETVTITLHHNDGTGNKTIIVAYRQHSEEEYNKEFRVRFPIFNYGNSELCKHSSILRWTERADGQGASYDNDHAVRPFNNMDLYAQWDLGISIPSTGQATFSVTPGVKILHVFDDGGPDKDYSPNCNGTLKLIAPENSTMEIGGEIYTEGKSFFYRTPVDYLAIFDKNRNKLSNDQAKSGSTYNNLYFSDGTDKPLIIGRLVNPTNEVSFNFVSDGTKQFRGLILDVDVKAPQSSYDISSKEDLKAYAGMKANLRLTQDIDLGEWDEALTLFGNLDGGGHTITYTGSSNSSGLFMVVTQGASVKHLRVTANVVTTTDCAGIARYNNGTISDCHFQGSITKVGYKGDKGIAGITLGGGTIDHCSATGSLVVKDSTQGGAAYPICRDVTASPDHLTWVSATDSTLYAAQSDSAFAVRQSYPVYAKGILDITKPVIIIGDVTMNITGRPELFINDGLRFSCSTAVTATSIEYTRRGTGGAYEPWVLPFGYTVDASMMAGNAEFYRFKKDSEGNIQPIRIYGDNPYLADPNEPLLFRTTDQAEHVFTMRHYQNGRTLPMTISIPAGGVAASMSSNKDLARVVATYDTISAKRAADELMYVWRNDKADFVRADGEGALLPFRYYLQYVDKATGHLEPYEQTDWARRRRASAPEMQLDDEAPANRRAPLATYFARGWQPVILDPRGDQTITPEMLDNYEILVLYDLYDEEMCFGPNTGQMAVTAIYEPAEEGLELPVAAALLVRAKRPGVEPLVTEQTGREIDALLEEAAAQMDENELMEAFEETHYWCSTFNGRYDVWQTAMPEDYSVLKELGALVYNETRIAPFFYRAGTLGDISMQPMSYFFTAYDARTFEHLPIANNRIEVMVLDRSEATGIDTIDSRSTPDGDAYNLKGQKVDDGYRGIIIKNGRKILRR